MVLSHARDVLRPLFTALTVLGIGAAFAGAPLVPADRVLVAESGITGPTDVKRFVAEGARVVLVGEALVRDGAPREAVAAMTGLEA